MRSRGRFSGEKIGAAQHGARPERAHARGGMYARNQHTFGALHLHRDIALGALRRVGRARGAMRRTSRGVIFRTRRSTRSSSIPAGDYTTSDKATHKNMPAFCRVVASVKAAPDSDIRVEIWLPKDHWRASSTAMATAALAALRRGYAGMEAGLRAATPRPPPTPAPPRQTPERRSPDRPSAEVEGLGPASTHVMTVTGKAIAKAFYGEDAEARLLHRLLHGRAAGPDRGAVLSRRL